MVTVADHSRILHHLLFVIKRPNTAVLKVNLKHQQIYSSSGRREALAQRLGERIHTALREQLFLLDFMHLVGLSASISK